MVLRQWISRPLLIHYKEIFISKCWNTGWNIFIVSFHGTNGYIAGIKHQEQETTTMNHSLNDDDECDQLTTTTANDTQYGSATATFQSDKVDDKPTNEYVLNIAFFSFLVFTILQFFFAITAKSQSMMTDCAAMLIDVVTYLFNYGAELMKHSNKTSKNEQHSLKIRQLYVELIPPLLSVTTLIIVTVMAMRDAFRKLLLQPEVNDDNNQHKISFASPDLRIMLIFSSMNLILDIINVTCFARVQQAIGLPDDWQHKCNNSHQINNVPDNSTISESSPLLRSNDESVHDDHNNNTISASAKSENIEEELNLNMCSAWTHICADTLRSIAVLIAAGIAWVFPEHLAAGQADSGAAIIVSMIILISLIPLIQGLFRTANMIYVAYSCYDNKPVNDDEVQLNI